MANSVFLFEIWDEKFCPQETDGGIYKIYFEGYPQHSYIGMTYARGGFHDKMLTHQQAIWFLYTGVSMERVSGESPRMTQNRYRKFGPEEKTQYDETFAVRREKKIRDYENDVYLTGEGKYFKMLIFMQMHHLTLHDLRFEILLTNNRRTGRDLDRLKSELITKNECYEKGFNSILATTYSNFDRKQLVDLELLKRLKILALTTTDEYIRWNCWRSLQQVFVDAFLPNIFGWMNYWKKISLPELKRNFAQLTKLLYLENQETLIFDIKEKSNRIIRQLLHSDNENVDFIFSRRGSLIVKNRINLDLWIENDQADYFLDQKITDQENQVLYQIYGSWADIQTWFKKFCFVQPVEQTHLIETVSERFLVTDELLKIPEKSLKRYRLIWETLKPNVDENDYYDEDEDDDYSYYHDRKYEEYEGEEGEDENEEDKRQQFIGDLIYDYYFVKNYLNSWIFK